MNEKFSELDMVLDGESWDWLSDNYPPLAESVQRAITKGVTPQEIRARVLDRLGAHRIALAQRCESAARFLTSGQAQ